MGKHKLDNLVEDTLLHYGIKGMKWDIRRTDEEIAAANGKLANAAEALEDAGDEVLGNESVGEELGDVLDILFGGEGNLEKETAQLIDATRDKLEDVSADIKKRGSVMMERMFGKSKGMTKGKTITGKDVKVKTSDVKPIKNPFTGKDIKITNKDGQEISLMRKKLKKPEFKAKNNFEGVDRKKLRNR